MSNSPPLQPGSEPPAWRLQSDTPSLQEVHSTIPVPKHLSFWRKLLAFSGPGYLVAVGYMDPGNWATDLAGGSAFGYTLLSVILLSNVMAILLQSLCAKLGIVTGRDLAQLCRDRFPRAASYPLWLLAEVAICATDLAELIGTAIALELLFGVPLIYGVLLTAFDVRNFPFAGTTVLIAVGVALETMKQIDSQLMMRNYEGFLK